MKGRQVSDREVRTRLFNAGKKESPPLSSYRSSRMDKYDSNEEMGNHWTNERKQPRYSWNEEEGGRTLPTGNYSSDSYAKETSEMRNYSRSNRSASPTRSYRNSSRSASPVRSTSYTKEGTMRRGTSRSPSPSRSMPSHHHGLTWRPVTSANANSHCRHDNDSYQHHGGYTHRIGCGCHPCSSDRSRHGVKHDKLAYTQRDTYSMTAGGVTDRDVYTHRDVWKSSNSYTKGDTMKEKLDSYNNWASTQENGDRLLLKRGDLRSHM